jgi:secretion/DNA translocation related TadE-like protein
MSSLNAQTKRAGGRERGASTVWMLAVLAVGMLVVMGAARLGVAAVAGARADSAADAAALAAADMLALGRGSAAAATAARETARANGARLTRCSCDGRLPIVHVVVDIPLLGAEARASARAEIRNECILGCEDPSPRRARTAG